jgi:glycyl-tRNA synthetase
MPESELQALFESHKKDIPCPKCGSHDFTPARSFNLLVKSNLGDFTGEGNAPVYLPGEACQGIYLNFKNIVDTTRMKVPFGIAQIGKAFRNEISPRNFLFRTREMEQADTQYFVKPNENKKQYEKIKKDRMNWYINLGIKPENLKFVQHENLVFYAKDAWDIEYNFPTGFDELEGIHDRSDYDLTQHMKHSGTDLTYTDPYTAEKYIPWILETSVGMGRMFLAFMSDAYTEDNLGGETRIVLKLSPKIAPIKVAVFPLLKNKPELVDKAYAIYKELSKIMRVEFDDNGNVGKRYRRQDEIGTPFCVTVDFETLGEEGKEENKDTVTVRDRDTGVQERVNLDKLVSFFKGKIQ